ncbi:hypothetical protein [Burkholderia ubonensis]|uniref:Uncharacterized protein n=1 Tax=Burkholderia ubonensis TaxID=101571 RepID=A0ABD4E0E9_9BURK|nr:hypothetical protein [Burkholderia ubonensis]KVN83432.1 hypothetical protein WJ68_16080 [Burkholderia ubonensis]
MNLETHFDRACEYAGLPFVPSINEAARLSLARVSQTTHARAARVIERCRFHVTGYVLSDVWDLRKAIVEDGAVRWIPNREDFTRVMAWQDTKGPNTPPDEAMGDALLGTATQAVSVPPVAPAAPSRPVLTAPPTANLLESTEAALGTLARELGCVKNEEIPHNAGWFVPGKAHAYASAYDAIQGLVASLKNGGTVYEPPAAVTGGLVAGGEAAAREVALAGEVTGNRSTAGKKKAAPEPTGEPVQGGLF